MSNPNPLIDAGTKLKEHLETLKIGDVVTEDFLAQKTQLVEQLQYLIETFLIESHQTQLGYQALQATLTEKPQSKP